MMEFEQLADETLATCRRNMVDRPNDAVARLKAFGMGVFVKPANAKPDFRASEYFSRSHARLFWGRY
jgi:hypothetical protein